MSITVCPECCNETHWEWDEAFDKFGFNDGDGLVMTEHVAEALRAYGYAVTIEPWGVHNVVINSIKRHKKELIPASCNLGYDDPRDYLPKRIVKILDVAFSPSAKVAP
jgi:hypothetical protein